MVGNNYLLFNQRLNFSSSSTFLTQRSKEDKQAQTVSGGQIDPTLLTTRGQNPNHTIYAAPRPAVLPAYISRSLGFPAFAQIQPPVSARGPPVPGSTTVLQLQGTPDPPDPGTTTVPRRPGTHFPFPTLLY
jgi:hypothetical protein